MSLLDALQRSGALRPVDLALAHSLQRIDATVPEPVLVGAALASFAVAQGHAAFDVATPAQLVDAAVDWPAPAVWHEAFDACPWVARPEDGGDCAADAPLVFERGRLYLRRYREYERRLADALARLAGAPAPAVDPSLDALHARLFPDRDHGDAQARAAWEALSRRLMLVTGGPGTGKTTTIARLLVLLAANARAADGPALRIALAAPTGRAADRMAASVRRVAETLRQQGIDDALCGALPVQAMTVHRLLGLAPGRAQARFDARHPLALDVLVVDEASMVDLSLMCRLAEALPTGAHLLLLGDRDQLPSVDAGDVLAALVDATERPPAVAAPLAGCRVHLDRGYRQTGALELEPLAAAVRRGDAAATRSALRHPAPGVHWHEGAGDALAATLREQLLPVWRRLFEVDDPAEALGLVHRQRVLTALREGPQGAAQLNARIEQALAGTHRDPYFHGRLLLVTENSSRHGLSNGDVGVCLRDADGSHIAWFDTAGGLRAFHPAALPPHTGAFAMTVHKAQGSEFDAVWLQLPMADTRVLSRELLYTGITRARSELHVLGPAAVLDCALGRHARRVSGLAWRLGAT